MMKKNIAPTLFTIGLIFAFCSSHEALAKKRKRRHYGPSPTHPVLLWARTLSESKDREERKVAAFKLSQYSQPIFQDEAIKALIKCTKDTDVELKVLCTKAMGKAGTKSNSESIRKVLVERYQDDPSLRNTIVRTLIVRQDNTTAIHDTLLDSAKKSTNTDELLALLIYFEIYGSGSDKFVDVLSDIYKRNEDIKVKRSVVKALGDRAHGQDGVIAIFSQCAETKDTPLLLTCLSGLQQQGKTDARTWTALEKTVASEDPDVLMAALDVINVLPEKTNVNISDRLVQIATGSEDPDLQEKAVLALGVCGDQSKPVVDLLQKLLTKKDSDEGLRVAAALILGRQAGAAPEESQKVLSKCFSEEKAQSLRTACQLGLSELETRNKARTQALSNSSDATPQNVTVKTTTTTVKTTTERKVTTESDEDKEDAEGVEEAKPSPAKK
jgi:hypothetical protein